MSKTLNRRDLLAGGMLAGSGAVLAGCGGLLPETKPSNLYSLSPKSTYIEDLPRVDWQLVVEEPYASAGLDTQKIAIYTNPYEVKYYAEARWAERAPRMVQTLLVESFENTGKIVSVGRQSVGLRSDFNLKGELREFQAMLHPGSATPDVLVSLSVKLITQPRQQIIASASFDKKVPAKGAGILDVVAAFDDALGHVLRETVQWTLLTAKKQG